MYEMLFDYARKNFDTVILSYLGNEITYQARLTNIDITASALVKTGVKENEKVVIMLPNIPEARYLIYACSKIGAIPNPIIPTISQEDIENIIKNTSCKKIFMMQGILKNYQQALQSCHISPDNIIEINSLRSAKGLYKMLYLINKDNYDNYLLNGKYQNTPPIKRKGEDLALIEQTGGTTGLTSKGALISNYNLYASNYQLEHGGFNFDSRDLFLDILLTKLDKYLETNNT